MKRIMWMMILLMVTMKNIFSIMTIILIQNVFIDLIWGTGIAEMCQLRQFEIPATNCYKYIILTFLVSNWLFQFLMTVPWPIFELQFWLSNCKFYCYLKILCSKSNWQIQCHLTSAMELFSMLCNPAHWLFFYLVI